MHDINIAVKQKDLIGILLFVACLWNAIVDKSGREFFGGPDFFCGREQCFLIEIMFFIVEIVLFYSREFFSQSRIFL